MRTPRVITGGRVVPVTGAPIDGGTVLLRDGRIEAVGDGSLPIPAGADVVDAAGLWVLPGLIDAHTHLGIQEDGNGAAGADHEEPTERDGSRLRAIDGLNPADPAFRDAVAGGVLAVGVSPGSVNPIGGQAVAVRCTGDSVDKMVLRVPCGVTSSLGERTKSTQARQDRWPMTRMGTAAFIRQVLEESRAAPERPGHDVIKRVLAGELPWRQHAHRADDIMTAVRLAQEYDYQLVIDRGTEAVLVADVLAERQVPVILGPLMVSRGSPEMRGHTLTSGAQLTAAGVQVALTTAHNANPIQSLAHQATFAVREGLDAESALEALTIVPAEILGIAKRTGSLTPGKDADLCLWSGDPLDVSQRVEAAYVGGELVYRYDRDHDTGLFGEQEWTL